MPPSVRQPPRARRLLARALTGPMAFALAGLTDVLVLLVYVARERVRRRYHRPGDAP